MKRRLLFQLTVTAIITALAFTGSFAEAKGKVKIGYIGPITGKVSAIGIGGRNSVDLAVDQRNADPNAKYEYELVVFDDECKPNIGVQAATKLAADKGVSAAVTHFCSAVATGTVDIYHRFGLPVIVWGAIAPKITYGNEYKEIHRTIGTLTSQNDVAAKYLRKLGYKKFVVIHDTTDYGNGHRDAFKKFLKNEGGDLLDVFGVTADQQDFTAELTKAKALDPDVVYFGGLSDLAIRIYNQMEKLGVNAQFVGVSGIISETYIKGTNGGEGTIAMRQGAPVETMPGGPAFIKQYDTANYDNPAEAYGIYAYSAMNVLLDAIETAGKDRKKIRDALNHFPKKEYAIGTVSFDDHGQNTFALITPLVVQDGKWVEWDKSEYAAGKRKLKGH